MTLVTIDRWLKKVKMKVKIFRTAKETFNQGKRQTMEWENITVSNISEIRLVSQLY